MKNILLLTILILAPAVFAQSAFTTGWSPKIEYKGNSQVVIVKGVSDTTDALYSTAFSLQGYDKVDLNTYPLTAGVKLSGTSTATRKVSSYIQASWDGTNWANIDTISTADSVNTLIMKTALNLNGYRAPYYRISVVGATTANDLTTFDIRLYAYRRD